MMNSHLLTKFVIKCTICLALVLSCHEANALFIERDDDFMSNDAPFRGNLFQIDDFEPVGQSFYASDDDIGTIGFFLDGGAINSTVHYADQSLNLSIYEGAGVHGPLLGITTASLPMTLNEGFLGHMDFDVSSLDFISGMTYSAVLTAPNPFWRILAQQVEVIDPTGLAPIPDYEGGDLILQGQLETRADAVFRILPKEQPREPRTYSLFVGIDDYDEKLWGSTDVSNLQDAFLRNGIIQDRSSYVFTNEDATKENITSFFSDLNVNENDKFVFYYSGHGDDGIFSTETTKNSGDEFLNLYGDVSFSDNDLTKLFKEDKWAGVEKLVILDTCRAGGFWGNNSPLDYGDLEKLDNIALLAAAEEGEDSHPAWTAGTGLFTDGLIAGLEFENGWMKADSNRDRQISVEEWDLWLQEIDNWYDWRFNPIVYEKGRGDLFYIDSPDFFQPFIAKSEDFQGTFFDMNRSAVPEPGTLMLMGSGLAGFVFFARRKRS